MAKDFPRLGVFQYGAQTQYASVVQAGSKLRGCIEGNRSNHFTDTVSGLVARVGGYLTKVLKSVLFFVVLSGVTWVEERRGRRGICDLQLVNHLASGTPDLIYELFAYCVLFFVRDDSSFEILSERVNKSFHYYSSKKAKTYCIT